MSLLDVLRAGVKIADSITKPLQGTVMYQRFSTTDEYGEKTPAGSPQSLPGIIDQTQRQVRTPDGTYMTVRATIDFIDAAAIDAATGGQGLSINDEFILPDGKKRPTLSVGGFVDAGTTMPVVNRVMLG